jgi:hypothetical protein
MTDDGSKIFDNNADVKAFLDTKLIKILPLQRY